MTGDALLWRSVLAALGTALAAAPLGCFVVWRRMAYFGDATAHAALLGVALALATNLPLVGAVLLVSVAMAVLLARLEGETRGADTTLGVLSHSALAIGLVTVSMVPGIRLDLSAYLLGDILAVGWGDVGIIWAGAAAVGALLAWRWSRLLLTTLGPELAIASGVDPRRERLVLTVALALVVAVAIKVVGALLISALLILPAAAARSWAATPERMAALAVCLASLAAVGGVAASFLADTPTGPSIVCVAALLFAAAAGGRALLPSGGRRGR
jgi:zinc transport system permease protein